MTEQTNLQSLFETHFKGKLAALESTRKNVLKRYFLGFLLVVALAAVNYLIVETNPPEYVIVISVAISAIGGFYYIYRASKYQFQYVQSFKSEIVTEIVRQINPEWRYVYNSGISQQNYTLSGLFPHHYDRYNAEDFVTGQIEKTDFEFSELHTQYKQVTYGSKGRRQEHWVTIFKGLFLHADFNKNFSEITYVLPDTAERLLGKFGQSLQKLSGRGELVKLENPEFEKLFVVYSTDQVESRYILTPTIMEAMVNLYNRFDGEIYFSFVGSRVYFANSISKSMFEPNIFRSGVNFNDVKEMFDLFGLISAVVLELNLNTRIWTKE
jgi:hypothetical protein